MIVTRTLAPSDLDGLLSTFNESFSDYVIPFRVTPESLRSVIARRGVDLTASIGAFEDGRMVAFTLNAVEGALAYDSGTGVIPSHRRAGLGRRVMEASIEQLRERRIAEYVLEVIETNTKAAELYRSLGFRERRRLQVWTYEPQRRDRITELANVDYDAIAAWGDVAPSWQNSPSSIRRALEPHAVLGNEDGALVVFPNSGDVPLLAVRRDARRRGLGRKLLDAAATRAAKPLRLVNVDDGDGGIAAFLDAVGAKRYLAQLEMTVAL